MSLEHIVRERIKKKMNWSDVDMDTIQFKDILYHDPFLYTGMEDLVNKLHQVAQHIKKTGELLIVDTDYDTDGVMSACVLHASLSLFGIPHHIYIPRMEDGYGLTPEAIDRMENQFKRPIHAILTADNGTNAIDGVQYAKDKGYVVLVTDHHLGGEQIARPDAMVNPNSGVDQYPFKGNAGAMVAWKAMMAYASRYHLEYLPQIHELVVFAGIANIADVMPIIDENQQTVREMNDILQTLPCKIQMRNEGYDRVFDGLNTLIQEFIALRNEDRKSKGKKETQYTIDDTFVAWYLSPLLNSSRRVEGTPQESFYALLAPTKEERIQAVRNLYAINKRKSDMKLNITDDLHHVSGTHSTVLFANTRHGMAGLIAGHIQGKTKKPTFVFAYPTTYENSVYPKLTFKDDLIIVSSARSSTIPLPDIINEVKKSDPNIIQGGGGHASAAGYSIFAKDLDRFKELVEVACEKLESTLSQDTTFQNHIRFVFTPETQDTHQCVEMNIEHLTVTDLRRTINFIQSIGPFGHGNDSQPTFSMSLIPSEFVRIYQYKPDFWKTFKGIAQGYEILTFDEELSKEFKQAILDAPHEPINCRVELTLNEFRGTVTPQIRLSKE